MLIINWSVVCSTSTFARFLFLFVYAVSGQATWWWWWWCCIRCGSWSTMLTSWRVRRPTPPLIFSPSDCYITCRRRVCWECVHTVVIGTPFHLASRLFSVLWANCDIRCCFVAGWLVVGWLVSWMCITYELVTANFHLWGRNYKFSCDAGNAELFCLWPVRQQSW